MAKRELFERVNFDPEDRRGWWYEDKSITEQDIVMPFLEKLKIRLAEIARNVDSDKVVGLVMAINEINILSQEFQKEDTNQSLNFESNVKAILECNFAGFKDEIIENACKLICNLKINDDRQKEDN